MLDKSHPKYKHIIQRLTDDVIIWLGSVRPDGRPHMVAVWFLWEVESETVLVFSKPGQQKVRNIQGNPKVMLALDNTNDGADVVMLDGEAEILEDAGVTTALPAYAEKYLERIKRIGLISPVTMAGIYSQAIRITPIRLY